MNFPKTLTALAISVVMTGCAPQNTAPPTHYQRFVPIPTGSFFVAGIPWHGYFALDTKTGTLCRTIKFKVFPKESSVEWANDVPSCNDVLAADKD
jgi:hypothetical protein